MMKTFTRAMRYTAVIAIAFLTTQCCNQQSGDAACSNDSDSTAVNQECTRLNIAYVQDSLLTASYVFAQETRDKVISMEESLQATLNQKQRALQNDANEFQRKLQNNAFLSQERAEQEANRLRQKEVELNNYAQNETQQLLIKSKRLETQVTDSIINFINEYNAEKKYEVILFKSATLYINPQYDITNEVVDLLNKRYAASKPIK